MRDRAQSSIASDASDFRGGWPTLDAAPLDAAVALIPPTSDVSDASDALNMESPIGYASESSRATLHAAAWSYAQRGWPVLPLWPGKKTPRMAVGGHRSATTDLDVIDTLWGNNPELNIGLRTGPAFDVLAIDGDEGTRSLALYIPDSYQHTGPVAFSGRDGGVHLYFAPTGTRRIKDILPKLDWCSSASDGEHGGYVVAPPSIHPNGQPYTWAASPLLPLPAAPGWLTRLINEKSPAPFTRRTGLTQYDNEDIIEAAFAVGLVVTRSLKAACPFHPQTRGQTSLQLYRHDNSFFCFSCRAHGFSWHLRNLRPIHRQNPMTRKRTAQ